MACKANHFESNNSILQFAHKKRNLQHKNIPFTIPIVLTKKGHAVQQNFLSSCEQHIIQYLTHM